MQDFLFRHVQQMRLVNLLSDLEADLKVIQVQTGGKLSSCRLSPVVTAALTSPFRRMSLTHGLIVWWPSPPTTDTTRLGAGRPQWLVKRA